MTTKLDSDLRNLINSDLLEQTQSLVKEERRISTSILYHLLEISQRLLYKELGFSNLMGYCVQVLKYSNTTANQLINAMSLLTDLPEIENKIEQGTLSVTTASRIQRFCKVQERVSDQKIDLQAKSKLIGAIEGKSKKEAETILKSMYPKPLVVKPQLKKKESDRDEAIKRVTLDDALMAKLERVKELSAPKKAKASYIELIDWLVETYLETTEAPRENKTQQKASMKKRSLSKKAKLANRQKKLPLVEVRSKKMESEDGLPPVKVRMRRKHISASTTRRVWEKTKGQCCYVSPATGRRCSERGGLEIEHIVPISRGGSDEPSNLLLFCKSHSLHSAIKKVSQDQVQKFIERLRMDEYRSDQGS